MAEKFMYIPNDDIKYYPFYRSELVIETIDTQLQEPINQNSIKLPKIVMPTNKKQQRTLSYPCLAV